MSTLDTHKAQAKHNEKLANKLSETVFIDWSITSAFYAALHYVEAAFFFTPEIVHTEACYNKYRSKMASLDMKKTMHVFRENLLGQAFPKIMTKYRQLRLASEAARYLLVTSDKTAFNYFPKTTLKRLLGDLKAIKKELRN